MKYLDKNWVSFWRFTIECILDFFSAATGRPDLGKEKNVLIGTISFVVFAVCVFGLLFLFEKNLNFKNNKIELCISLLFSVVILIFYYLIVYWFII